jgi:hypothetical protein
MVWLSSSLQWQASPWRILILKNSLLLTLSLGLGDMEFLSEEDKNAYQLANAICHVQADKQI